ENPNIEFNGNININSNDIDKEGVSKFDITNCDLMFDTKMENLKAKKVFVSYEKDKFKFDFEEPIYKDVRVDGSNGYFDVNNKTLGIKLKTKNLLNDTLKDALLRYNIVTPLNQKNGKNDVFAEVVIPFGKNNVTVKSIVNIKDSDIELFGQTLHFNHLNISSVNKKLKVDANISSSFKKDDSIVNYNFSLTNSTDFETKLSNGFIVLNNLEFNDIYLKNANFKYNVNFKDKIKMLLEGDKFEVYKTNKRYKVNDLSVYLEDKMLVTYLNINDKNKQEDITLNISDTTMLDTKESSGIVNLDYKNNEKNITIISDNIKYQGSFKKVVDFNVNSNNIKIKFNKNDINLNDLNIKLNDKTINTKVNIKDNQKRFSLEVTNKTNISKKDSAGDIELSYNDNNITLNSNNINYNITNLMQSNQVVKLNALKVDIKKNEKQFYLKSLSLNFKDNLLYVNSLLSENMFNSDSKFDTIIDLKDKTAKGFVKINQFLYKDLIDIHEEKVYFDLDFSKGIKLFLPKYKLNYIKSDDGIQNINIKNITPLLNYTTFVDGNNSDVNISILLDEKDKNISIDNLNLDINTTSLESLKDVESKDGKDVENKNIILPLFPKLNLKYNNGYIKYNKFKIDIGKLNIDTNANTSSIILEHKKTKIDISTIDNKIKIKNSKITDKYFNNLIGKEILDGDHIILNINGDDINMLNGKISIKNTTIKNVAILNNLIAFINTTPAIINPLLALPTLYRMSQTGFDTNGYLVKKGYIKFIYSLKDKKINAYDVFTRGTMSNFNAKLFLDLDKKYINSNIDVVFLKDYSNVIKNIPLVGYIIMGKDGDFHTSVDIVGPLSKPEIDINTLSDTIEGVGGVVKRILTLPAAPFMDVE
ncbi:MAG: AsmA-like C-terminal domain-containing protein, partial [Campylobacterota bacterium]|nr:AsmA-like C-terminal domain-containing protein [Campylobacterota bacterium]